MLACGWQNAQAWCGGTEQDDWKEFASLYSAGPPPTKGRPIMYILGAPWCPYCAQSFRSLQTTSQYKFDVRYLPAQGSSELHSNQIADIAIDGSTAALVRVYVQKTFAKGTFTDAQKEFVEEVQDATDNALRERFGGSLKGWGTPTAFLLSKENVIRVGGGLPNLALYDRTMTDHAPAQSVANTRRFIKSGIPKETPITGTPFSKKGNVRLRVLPDDSAFSAMCFDRPGIGLASASGVITIDRIQWLVFKQWRISKPSRGDKDLRIYGRAEDFGGWQVR